MLFFALILGVHLRGAQTCRGYRVAAVALNVGRGFTPADLQEKVTFFKGELHPSPELTSKLVSSMPPSSAEEGYRKVMFCG